LLKHLRLKRKPHPPKLSARQEIQNVTDLCPDGGESVIFS
jgi:hypothetical protein